MGEVVRFVPKSELERARLIREARVIYEHIFPPADQASKRPDPDKEQVVALHPFPSSLRKQGPIRRGGCG